MPELTTTIQLWATGLATCTAGISLAVYARDRHKDFFINKTVRIAPAKGAKGTILLAQYGVVALVAASFASDSPWLAVVGHSPPRTYAGLLTGSIGLLIFLTAKRSLGTNYTPCFNAYMPHGLTTTGIYSVIRHPIYVANLLLIFAGFLISGSLYILGILALLARIYSQSARHEEQALAGSFPGYHIYMQSTGRFFPRFFRSFF